MPAPLDSLAPGQSAHRDVIVVGGSAGALDTMLALAAGLPADFGGSVLIVSHIGPHPSQLPDLLRRAGPLPAKHAETQETLRSGHIYIAPPDRHLLLGRDGIRLSRGPREHFTRPAIDPLFRSAARAFGPRVIGVVLSGTGSDGAAGLEAIRRAGGATVGQDPADSLFPEMPRTALDMGVVEHLTTGAELAGLILRLAAQPAPARAAAIAKTGAEMKEFETPTAMVCPECGGALREEAEMPLLQYRCHIGHRFSAKELLVQQRDEVEGAVAVALRVLNEHAELCRRMIESARSGGRTHGVAYWRGLRTEAEEQLKILRDFLSREQPAIPEEPEAEMNKSSAQVKQEVP